MSEPTAQRQHLMRIAALATSDELAVALAAFTPPHAYEVVRPPEAGLVMIEGRMGGDGAAFNLGEATVTRAVVRLATGEIGFSYLLGRRPMDAERAAVIDALGQRPSDRAILERSLVSAVTSRRASEADRQRAEADATRVAFFTLERGESPA